MNSSPRFQSTTSGEPDPPARRRTRTSPALQAKEILASVRPRDSVGKTRKRLALEQLAEMVAVEKKMKAYSKALKALGTARRTTSSTSPRPARSASTAPAGPTTSASSPLARPGIESHPLPQEAHLRRPVPTTPSRRPHDLGSRRERGSGRAPRGVSCIQRSRLTPAQAKDHHRQTPRARLMTTEGSRGDAFGDGLIPVWYHRGWP